MFPILFAVLQALAQDDVRVTAKQEESVRFNLELWRNLSGTGILDVDEISGYSLALPRVLTLVADEVIIKENPEADGVGGRIGKFLLILPTIGIFNVVASGATHEYGHFRAYSRFGFRDFEFLDPLGNETIDGNPGTAFTTQFDTHFLGGAQHLANVGDYKVAALGGWDKEFAVMAAGGGFNQQQYNCEMISRDLFSGPAHFLEGFTYFSQALGVILYPNGNKALGSDIGGLRHGLADLGVEVSSGDLRFRSQLPKLFGNSSLSFLSGLWRYFANGDKFVEAISYEVGDFRFYWPEFTSYFTLHGPTVKAIAPLIYQNQFFALTYEKALVDSLSEVGLEWRGALHAKISLEALGTVAEGEGWWLEVGPVIRPLPWLGLGFKYYQGQGYTFRREIAGLEPEFLEDRESGVKLFAELSIRF